MEQASQGSFGASLPRIVWSKSPKDRFEPVFQGSFGANLPRIVWSKSSKDHLEQVFKGSFGASLPRMGANLLRIVWSKSSKNRLEFGAKLPRIVSGKSSKDVFQTILSIVRSRMQFSKPKGRSTETQKIFQASIAASSRPVQSRDEQCHARSIAVWLTCDCPWKYTCWRVWFGGDDLERPRLWRLPKASLETLDELLLSVGLGKLQLMRDHPGEPAYHKFRNTIAGLAVLKLPPALGAGVGQHAGPS